MRRSGLKIGTFACLRPEGPKPALNRPQTTPAGPRTTSNCNHKSCSHTGQTLRGFKFIIYLESPPFYKRLTAHKWGATAAPGLSWAHVLSHPVGLGGQTPPGGF